MILHLSNDNKKNKLLECFHYHNYNVKSILNCSLMENVRVRRAGYAFRQVYSQFLFRYKMLASDTWPFWHGEPKDGVRLILNNQQIQDEEYAFGKTKIFIRNPRMLFEMEERRRQKMHDLATMVQKIWKGWKQRMFYKLMRKSQILISARFRGFWAQKQFLLKKKAAILVQCYVRGWKARVELRRLKRRKLELWSVAIIRKYYQGWVVRKTYRSKFRKQAGPKVVKFLVVALVS